MTYTDVYVYNKSLGQRMHVGLPGIIYKEMERDEQLASMKRLADPEMAEVLEKYDFVIEGIERSEIPAWAKSTAEEIRTFMESYPVDITISLPEDFLVRDLAKIYDILGEYDDEPEYFSWDKDSVYLSGEPSDIAECIRDDINMLYPEVKVEIVSRVVERCRMLINEAFRIQDQFDKMRGRR